MECERRDGRFISRDRALGRQALTAKGKPGSSHQEQRCGTQTALIFLALQGAHDPCQTRPQEEMRRPLGADTGMHMAMAVPLPLADAPSRAHLRQPEAAPLASGNRLRINLLTGALY